jgi:hypothetical protein
MKSRPFLDLTPGGSSTANPEAGRAGSRFSSNMLIIAIEEARCLAWFRLLGATLHCAVAQHKLCRYRIISSMHIVGL